MNLNDKIITKKRKPWFNKNFLIINKEKERKIKWKKCIFKIVTIMLLVAITYTNAYGSSYFGHINHSGRWYG